MQDTFIHSLLPPNSPLKEALQSASRLGLSLPLPVGSSPEPQLNEASLPEKEPSTSLSAHRDQVESGNRLQ